MKLLPNTNKTKRRTRSSNVPGQALGYSLQVTRFVSCLLEAPKDGKVSLEVFEDVGVETSDKRRKAVQSKSALEHNPVSDRAVDLWKTFHNWIATVEAGEIEPEQASFEIYVSKKVGGPIVDSFSDADTFKKAKAALQNAKGELWGKAPAYEQKKSVGTSIQPYVEYVFNCDEKVICSIITNFRLVTGSGSPQTDLKEMFSKCLIPDDLVDDVHSYALGWVKKKTDLALEQKKPAIIDASEFRAQLQSFVRKHDTTTILCSFAKDPQPQEIEAEIIRNYVRQLQIIDATDDQTLRAITDYLKASIDRTDWSVKGLVFETSFSEFEASLVRAWDNLRIRTTLAHKQASEEEKGQALYAECSLHRANLQNMETPDHFVPGSFNALADALTIGWHPDYKNRIKTHTAKNEKM